MPQFVREQEAAYKMFSQYFTTEHWRANLSEEKIEALGFYTTLLVENRSPESDLLYAGLRELDGHWSEQRIIDAAESTIQAARRTYASTAITAGSKSGTSEPDKPTSDLAERRVDHPTYVMGFSRKLRDMIERKQADG